MNRFCYCSPVLPGKEETIRQHWQNKGPISWEEISQNAHNRAKTTFSPEKVIP